MGSYRIIDAGRLDRRITIQYAEITRSGTGAEVKVWKEWASGIAAEQVRPMINPKEGIRDNYVLISEQFTDWNIRYRRAAAPKPAFPDSKMRLFDQAYPAKMYDIENVEEIGRREGWTIRTKLSNS